MNPLWLSHFTATSSIGPSDADLGISLQTLPGVEHAALASALPVWAYNSSRDAVPEGRPLPPSDQTNGDTHTGSMRTSGARPRPNRLAISCAKLSTAEDGASLK